MLTHYKNHDDGLESDTPVTGLSLILNINTKPALIGIVSKIGVEDFFQCTFRKLYSAEARYLQLFDRVEDDLIL